MAEISGTGAHLNAAQLRVWTSLLDASRILDTELEAVLVSNHGMTHREYEVLVRIDGAGGRARMSTLARQIEASAALISQTVAKLEARGWLERTTSPEDRRGIDATLTPAGRTALATASAPHAALIERLLLDRLGDKTEAVGESLGEVADHLRAHRAGEPCSDLACPMTN